MVFNQATEVKLESSSCCSGFITKGIDEDVSTVFSTDTGFWSTQEQVSSTMLARDFKCPKLLTIVRKNGDVVNRKCTPLEYCRLQGFPDWWEDGVEGSDSARYKMWGNGMALPNMLHVMRGIRRISDEQ